MVGHSKKEEQVTDSSRDNTSNLIDTQASFFFLNSTQQISSFETWELDSLPQNKLE